MPHHEVFKQLKKLFPHIASNAVLYFPNGRNSIHIRQNKDVELIFTYTSPKDWRLETSDCFVKRTLKIEDKMCNK